MLPIRETKIGDAAAIASGAGLPLVAPELDGLNTSDGYHLDRPSADRWARAFLEAAGPEIRSCLEKAWRDALLKFGHFDALLNRSGRLPCYKAPPPEVRS